jgi:hypothetical protein
MDVYDAEPRLRDMLCEAGVEGAREYGASYGCSVPPGR